jgi:hypothetical protein
VASAAANKTTQHSATMKILLSTQQYSGTKNTTVLTAERWPQELHHDEVVP